jgi:hypothetical protein
MTLEQMYQQALAQGDDIAGHLPRLRWLAKLHFGTVVEFGTRQGVSTVALLAGNKLVESYDIEPCPNAKWIAEVVPSWRFHQRDVLKIRPIKCDMLFIDTNHTYEQLSAELARHADGVKATIALHDTYCQVVDGENDPAGMWRAIDGHLAAHPEWSVVFDEPDWNGLTVLGRV